MLKKASLCRHPAVLASVARTNDAFVMDIFGTDNEQNQNYLGLYTLHVISGK